MPTFELLGCGTSIGTPVPGCDCKVCQSTDPRDHRYRSSALIRSGDFRIVIDTGPEFRLQALRAKIMRLDAVLYTHAHADHIYGLDDVRPFTFKREEPLPLYAQPGVLDDLRIKFAYIWKPFQKGGGVPEVELHPLEGPLDLGGVTFIPVLLMHGKLPVYGYRMGRMAYFPDVSAIPEESMRLLEGLEVLVIDACRKKEHPTHFSYPEAIEVARELGVKEAYLTHLSHDYLYERDNPRCPEGIELAYDGLKIEF